MIESNLASSWASTPNFSQQITSWLWFKKNVGDCFQLSAQRQDFLYELNSRDLAEAFFHWVGYVDNNADLVLLDSVDHAHFSCGMLLRSLIVKSPITISIAPNNSQQIPPKQPLLSWPEGVLLVSVAMTLLEGWRLSLGAQKLILDVELIHKHWDSFRENTNEDTYSAIPFFDLFLGLDPVWENAMTAGNRPAMKMARYKIKIN